MRTRVWAEELALLGTFLKWCILASLVGGVAGAAGALFLQGVSLGVSGLSGLSLPWRLVILPLAGLATGWLIWRLAPGAAGHGTEAVLTAVHRHHGDIDFRIVPVKALATIISLSGGGSAGKEGPCTQIGAGLASALAKLLKLSPSDRRRLVICGIGAGFTAVFGTPVGGAIFAVEVLFGGSLVYELLLPSLVAGFTAYQVAQWFGVHYLEAHIPPVVGPAEPLFLKALALGILFGLIALLFIECMEYAHRTFTRLRVWPPLRPAVGGLVLGVLALVAGPQYLGLGLESVELALLGGTIPLTAFLWKILFTAVTVGSGWSGGVVMPLFFIGATAGSVLAPLVGIDPAVGAAMGMVGVLSGATNTPIACTVVALELFGTDSGLYLAAACVASFVMSGHRSVYPSQMLAIRKSPAFYVPLNHPAGEVKGQLRLSTTALRPMARWRRRWGRWPVDGGSRRGNLTHPGR